MKLQPPASGDRVLPLVPSLLNHCRLCRDGIATSAVGAAVLAAPRLARERHASMLVQPSTPAAAATTPDPGAAGSSRLSATRVRKAIDAGGTVTTLATLITALDIDNDADEKRLRELLYNLRIEGVIEFDRPLGRFSAIHRAGQPTSY